MEEKAGGRNKWRLTTCIYTASETLGAGARAKVFSRPRPIFIYLFAIFAHIARRPIKALIKQRVSGERSAPAIVNPIRA